MDKKMIPISEASKMLGVSAQTLRRWSDNGKFPPGYISPGKHRYYSTYEIEKYTKNLSSLVKIWATASVGELPPLEFYCPNSSIFQARLSKFETVLSKVPELITNHKYSLIVSVVGEIGNNSFDHNLGNWPDIPGIYFAYDINKRLVVLADRGLGIYTTLKRVRPNLQNDQEALQVAFTEYITGRSPESRGNGLKYVKSVITNNNFRLLFKSGDASLDLDGKDNKKLRTEPSDITFRGTIALIQF